MPPLLLSCAAAAGAPARASSSSSASESSKGPVCRGEAPAHRFKVVHFKTNMQHALIRTQYTTHMYILI